MLAHFLIQLIRKMHKVELGVNHLSAVVSERTAEDSLDSSDSSISLMALDD